jgi:2-oxoglutarate ferredoxin oxidoreductase subunit alpha
MTETVSLAGMIETPLVIVIAQRPGPATGLPTWTAQADLNLAIFSSHGEFPRAVIAVSDPTSCFELTQKAFNIAEEYQIPVILLTEKTIAEAKTTVDVLEQNSIPIVRGLENNSDLSGVKRYEFTENGISKRWVPGSSNEVYFANGDEHKEDGTLEEGAEGAKKMIEKRMKKLETLRQNLPEPTLYGERVAKYTFVGWGSSKNVMLDIIDYYAKSDITVNYLHYDYVWPVKTEKLIELFDSNENVFLIESNYQGQLGQHLEAASNRKFKDKLLKYDGRPFYFEDLINFISSHNE